MKKNNFCNPSLYNKSKKTTVIISKKMNDTLGKEYFVVDEKENFKTDGMFNGNRKVEFKQRQSEIIAEWYKGEKDIYDDIDIHKSSTEHGADIFCIYDKTLEYAMLFSSADIRYDLPLDVRTDKVESEKFGNKKVNKYRKVESKNVRIVKLDNVKELNDALNYCETRRRLLKEFRKSA